MIRLLIILIAAAGIWFAYTNCVSMTKNVNIENAQNAIKQEKTIQNVMHTRSDRAQEVEDVTR